MSKIIKIEATNLNYMLPIRVEIGKYAEYRVYCDRYEIDNEYFYCWVDHRLVFAMNCIDIENIIIRWKC